ncbi:MAG: S9 family peptidase [Bacteroidales bacterium]|nr:S9 family peptidase [Bacteroidales bacterium]
MKKIVLFTIVLVATLCAFGQVQKISVESIWDDFKFYPRGVSGYTAMPASDYYTVVKRGGIERYSFETGDRIDMLLSNETLSKLSDGELNTGRLSGYSFSNDEKNIILSFDEESIWRRSSLAFYYVYNIADKTLKMVADTNTKLHFAELSEDGQRVLFARDCDLFIQDMNTGAITQITHDGEPNAILNGYADWVYEEELDMSQAASWSPDGSKVAFLRFDERRVKEFTMPIYDGLYPTDFTYKYPKAGEDNSLVDVYIYDVASKSLTRVDLGDNTNCYFPRVYWQPNSRDAIILKLNRHQDRLDFIRYNTLTKQQDVVYTDENDKWLDITDDYYFLSDGKTMIVTSERDGFNHIYKVTLGGGRMQLTSGNWEVNGIKFVNEKKKLIYYQSNESGVLNRDLYVINFDGKKKKMLSTGDGWNESSFCPTGNYYRNQYSNLNTLPVYTICNASGKQLRVLNDNHAVKETMDEYGFQPREIISFTTADGTVLYGWMLKPANFNPNKRYPVMMNCYGGPGSQQVMNAYSSAQDLAFYQMLAQHGYISVCVDGRGTATRGDAFKKVIYQQMGKYEAIDQIAAANYLKTLPFVDGDRIGIWGWSFGGYLSALSMFRGDGAFKMAISVAPVTNWRYYDNIYTERFMRTPQENPDGYDLNSPTTYADQLNGKYFLIHGTADDNVHFQNAMELVKGLNEAGKEYDQFFFPNKNHFIMGGNTRTYLYNKLAKYILENL